MTDRADVERVALTTAPSEIEVSDVIAQFNRAGLPDLALIVRRLAFQRDALLARVEQAEWERDEIDSAVRIGEQVVEHGLESPTSQRALVKHLRTILNRDGGTP